MEDFRRHPYWCPRGHPEGVKRFDVFFDFGAFPVWGKAVLPAADGRPARAVYGMARPEFLGISPQLTRDLQAWAEWQDRHGDLGRGRSADPQARAAHQAEGRELADRLARETSAVVVYGKPRQEDFPPDCPHCGIGRRP